MTNEDPDMLLAFVWPAEDIKTEVVQAAGAGGARAVFDLTGTWPDEVENSLSDAEATDVLISTRDFFDANCTEALNRTQVNTLWIEYHPALDSWGPEAFLARLAELAGRWRIIPVSGDPGFLSLLTDRADGPKLVALKGSEAAGLSSAENANILFATFQAEYQAGAAPTELIIWGGVSCPEAAAAFLACGARGIVFESLHWMTDMVTAKPGALERLARFRPEQTSIVGQNLGLSYRFYNKGNSTAIKDLAECAASLCSGPITDENLLSFIEQAREKSESPLESDWGRDRLIPIGPEAAGAAAFIQRFGGSTAEALTGFLSEVRTLVGEAGRYADHYVNSPVARELGVEYPFIQGAMSWISDVPEFALAVSKAGGLPTVALGLRNRAVLQEELGRLKETMGSRSYALNCIALAENPYLEEQLTLLEELKPPFVVIAAGEPSHARRLLDNGIQVIYIAPDEELMRVAFSFGIKWVVLEGNEAGGHVGAQTTLTLAQNALELRRREPALFEGRRLVLAGGIYNRRTAFWAAMMGADAVQMGTVYLASEEIVTTGALTALYQKTILASPPGATAVSGRSVGLGVRALRTPVMESILNLERDSAARGETEEDVRQRLEVLSAGSLYIAARGKKSQNGTALDEDTCLREGQYMSGASAGAINQTATLAEIHRELAQGAIDLPILEETSRPRGPRTMKSENGPDRVVITGWSLVNSLGSTPEEIWNNSLAMKSGVSDIPVNRWDHNLYYDPNPGATEKTYCRVGAFLDLDISRKELGISPQDFRTMAESTRLTMFLAHKALQSAGLLDSDIPRERISVLISQNSGESASTMKDLVVCTLSQEILQSLKGTMSIDPDKEQDVLDCLKAGRIKVDDTTLLGRLNCAAGGFICNKYGFQGPSYSVTAACATSQVALFNAIQMIRANIIDAAIVGGGEEKLSPAHFLEFSALGALAGLSGRNWAPHQASRPFDAERDGMVLGEGGGMVIVERESVARRRGARIYGYISGMGASNSAMGMVESGIEPQRIAMRAAFKDSGISPETIDLVECHATGTVQGDVVEVEALKGFFPQSRPTVLASFKSQIGHTLGASGLNSLIRGLMAINHGIYPGTLNYNKPDPEIGLEEWGFLLPDQPAEWASSNGRPKRVMINAFGFGGANYVVLAEECRDGRGVVLAPPDLTEQNREETEPAPATAAPALDGISFFSTEINGRPYRLGVVAEDQAQARAKIQTMEPAVPPFTKKWLRALNAHGLTLGAADEPTPPLSLVFAGQGTTYPGMGREFYETFPLVREWMDRIAALAEFDLLDVMFKTDDSQLKNTLWQQPALYCLEYAMVRQLLDLGLKPAAMAGHSMGELTALAVAGVFSWKDGFHIVNKRAQCMDKAAGLSVDPGVMIAVNAPLDYLEKEVAARENVYFTNYNAPTQVVIGGGTKEVLALMEEFKAQGHWTVQLKVSMAFHSPIMALIHDEMAEFVAGIDFKPAQIPVISNTTMKPYPDDPDEVRRIIMAHLEQPVHWMQNARTLWDDYGVRHFIEIGPKATLCNLIADTLEESVCLNTCHPEGEAEAYRVAAARTFALGHLQVDPDPPKVVFPGQTALKPLRTAPAVQSAGTPDDRLAAIVQREINSFVLESFGKFLKPAILEAIRREADPSFTEDRLDQLLGQTPTAPVRMAAPAPAPQTPAAPAPEDREPAPAKAGPAAAPAQVLSPDDYLEQVIRIIMDATGYERDEIEPDMDIRQDLSIRSSRLPVIMDAAERQFNITIQIEDFMGVRTIRSMAERITELAQKSGTGPAAAPTPAGEPAREAPSTAEEPTEPGHRPSLKRLVFEEILLEDTTGGLLDLPEKSSVAVLTLGKGSALVKETAAYLKNSLKARPGILELEGQYDLAGPDGPGRVCKWLAEASPLAGLVLVLDGDIPAAGRENTTAFLTGFFTVLQAMMKETDKRFCLLVSRNLELGTPAALAAEGVLGMFLAAAHEYGSVMFRSLDLEPRVEFGSAAAKVFDPDVKRVELIGRESGVYTVHGVARPLTLEPEAALSLAPGDVIVLSGGGRGITARIARSLAPYKPRLVLMGRTAVDLSAGHEALIKMNRPGPEMDVAQTLKDLSDLGLEVSYYSCDVAEPKQTAEVLGRIVKETGRIDGIVHGAGIIRDSFLDLMSAENFNKVVSIKLDGALNLYEAAREHGLRFMAVLSSVAAVQGNPGQVNYCAANRAMSALMSRLADGPDRIKAKAFMLPPIQGAGMADTEELRELFKRRKMEDAFLHVDELAELFCRELLLGPAGDQEVLLARVLPRIGGIDLDLSEPEPAPELLTVGGTVIQTAALPMIDGVEFIDLAQGRLKAHRAFSAKKDLWIEDHRPFQFLKNPLVSGIMAVETLLEAARLLHPHLVPVGIESVHYQDVLACPYDVEVPAIIQAEKSYWKDGRFLVDLNFASAGISSSGRVLDRWSTNYTGEVIMAARAGGLNGLEGFPIKKKDLDTRPLKRLEVAKIYEKETGMTGRYRVLESLDGSGPEVIRGHMIYELQVDFAHLDLVDYQYSPYILEGIMHLFAFHKVMRDQKDRRNFIPYRLGRLLTSRKALPGERITLQARRRSIDDQGVVWDAQAVDQSGQILMTAEKIAMRWFEE